MALGTITRDEMQQLVAAWHAGNDATNQPHVQAMVAAETARIHQAFAQLPIQVQFVEHDPYASFEEMRDQVQSTGTMLIYKGGSETPLWDEHTNWMARAVHDWDHILKSCDFSMEGEAAAFRHAAQCRPGLAPLYMSEVMLQAAIANVEGGFVPQKLVVLPEHLQRYAEKLRGLGAASDAPPIPPEGIVNLVWLTAGLLRVSGPEATMVHLAAGGVDEQTALLTLDAAQMLNAQVDQAFAGTQIYEAAAGRPEPEGVAGLGKTQWVDEVLSKSWDRIAQVVPAEWMPTRLPALEENQALDTLDYRPPDLRTKVIVEEYGCGFYGCVAPTSDPSVVLKITTDFWEAMFARSAMELARTDGWPAGIVQYFQVLQPRRAQRAGNIIYLLWREEAYDIGGLFEVGDEATNQLSDFRNATRVVLHGVMGGMGGLQFEARMRMAVKRQKLLAKLQAWAVEWTPRVIGYREGQRVIYPSTPNIPDAARKQAVKILFPRRQPKPMRDPELSLADAVNPVIEGAIALQSCRLALVELAGHGQYASTIAAVLNYYIDKGWLLGDVHSNNVGLVNNIAAITDPGVAIPLIPENLTVEIPVV